MNRCQIWKMAGFAVRFCGLLFLFSGLARAGTIISFDAPGAGTGPAQGTFSLSINSAGTITGNYIDANNVFHGFVRTADGTITSFDAPDAGTSFFQGTLPVAISLTGVITGSYADASSLSHGFVRAINGTITPFDAPGAGPFGTTTNLLLPHLGHLSGADSGMARAVRSGQLSARPLPR